MKRLFTAIITFATLLSCTKVEQPKSNIPTESFVFNASIESTICKAEINNVQTVWKSNDKVGLFVYKPDVWETGGTTSLTLSSGEDTSVGEFGTWEDNYDNSGMNWDYVAFFPYERTSGEDGTKTINGTSFDKANSILTVQLPNSYYCYSSGQSFMPLIADLSKKGSTRPDVMNFKHAGGAILLSISSLPGSAKSIGMVVTDKTNISDVKNMNITGGFSVNPANAGQSTGKITASEGDNNSIWLNITPSENSYTYDSFDFIFPVPTIDNPSLSFTMYDKNGLKIWSKTASNQQNITRAHMLVLETSFTAKLSNLYLRGWINGADLEDNSKPFTDGALNSVTFTQDSYVYIFSSDLEKPYCPGTPDTTENNVECWKWNEWNKSTCNKVKVAAGTYNFTISYNSNGTISLSYSSAS